jgi:hypothetical protein
MVTLLTCICEVIGSNLVQVTGCQGVKFFVVLMFLHSCIGSLRISVSIETRLLTGRPWFNSRQGQIWDFFFATVSRHAIGSTGPHVQWVPEALSPGVKWPGHESNYSPPSNAEIKNGWSYTSTLPKRLHGVVLN